MSGRTMDTETLRYPIGRFSRPEQISPAEVAAAVDDIEAVPGRLRRAVAGLDEAQLETPYRPDGWTVRQVVHHLADSHMNAYVRTKLALTEDEPRIVAYREDLWARLPDSQEPLEVSLTLLEGLHRRWVRLLRSLDEAQWRRCYLHPELGRYPLAAMAALYQWHGRHHVAHVTELRRREGWDG